MENKLALMGGGGPLVTRIVQLTDRHRTLALQARKFRQVLHDERCRPILERVAQHYSGRLSSAVKLLAADGIPAPGGKRWHRKAVWLIAKRLGIQLGSGLAFGEGELCAKCGRQVGRVYGRDYCRTCKDREFRQRVNAQTRRLELEEAGEKLAQLQAKIETLETGGRHYPAGHRARRSPGGHS